MRYVALLFDVNKYLFKFDLKSGYDHVGIHPQWETKGVACNFMVLPFGLSTSCYLFTKIM